MSAVESIQALGSHHASLLQSIAALDYAQAAADQQRIYIDTLNSSLAKIEKDLKYLDIKMRIERNDADDIKNSFSRRLAYKLTGQKAKFEARASKEEREYLEAEEALSRAKSQKITTIELLADAESALAKYVADAQKHRDLNDQLESLYHQVFGGLTPSFPMEDVLENAVSTSQYQNSAAQTALVQETQVMSCLQNATLAMQSCLAKLSEAERASQWDMWGGGNMADMMERNALSGAQAYVHEVQMFLTQAKGLDTRIRDIGPMQIAQGSIMSDVFFDNIFTDMAFHEQIQSSVAQASAAARSLAAQVSDAQRRLDAATQMAELRSKQLRDDRARLTDKRREIFETVGGGTTNVSAMQMPAASRELDISPPPYTSRK